jgi:hypothetical protein
MVSWRSTNTLIKSLTSLDIVYSVSPIGDYASGGAVIEFRDVTSQKKLERERLAAIVQNEQQSGKFGNFHRVCIELVVLT